MRKNYQKISKGANVKFLMKPGKDAYYNGSSYRPISLTSVLGKCMERIIHARLYAYAEHHKILETEQDGFGKYRGTIQSQFILQLNNRNSVIWISCKQDILSLPCIQFHTPLKK